MVALGDPVTGVIPAKMGVAHLRRLRRHRQQVGAMALPLLAGGACPPAAPPPACIRNEPAQSASRVDSKVDRTKPPGRDTGASAPLAAALVTSAAVGTDQPEFDKTKPQRVGADVSRNSRAPAPRGRAREQPANLALLGLAMLKLSRR
jgi:hypothetical protein